VEPAARPDRLSWFDERGLALADGRHLPVYAGAMHYWRLDPARWAACLAGLRGLGLALVETYVPWSVHERAPGRYDWSGRNDLGRFLDLAAEAGLAVVLRPGPHCNAELTGFGYPDRILRDDALRARAAHGGPVWLPAPPRAFPVPSYASDAFHAEVAAWYRAVAEVVAPRLAPAGPVVALGVDNEAQAFFRLGAYDHDYHPDLLAWWSGGSDRPAPRRWDPDDAATCVRWVRAKDEAIARALGRLAGALDDAGLGGVARFHNLPPGEPQWFDLPAIGRAVGGPAGIDVYAGGRDLGAVRRRGLHLAGSAAPLPLVPELGVGCFPWFPPLTGEDRPHDEQRDVALTLVGAGVRGMSFYMAVARERWYGAALDEHGQRAPAAAWVARLCEVARELDLPALRRRADVAVVVSRADARFALASSLLDPATPVVAEALGLGPAGAAALGRDAAAIDQRRWLDVVQRALDHAQIPYALVDESAPERLAGYRAAVLPTLDRVDAALLDHLRRTARDRVLVLGPGSPTRDELGQPLADAALPRRSGLMKPGSLADLDGLADDLAAVAPPPEAWVAARGSVDVMPLHEPGGAVRAVVVVNRGERTARAEVAVPGPTVAQDPFSGETVRGDAALPVTVGAHAARLLVVR
jgi:beta-galactosidase